MLCRMCAARPNPLSGGACGICGRAAKSWPKLLQSFRASILSSRQGCGFACPESATMRTIFIFGPHIPWCFLNLELQLFLAVRFAQSSAWGHTCTGCNMKATLTRFDLRDLIDFWMVPQQARRATKGWVEHHRSRASVLIWELLACQQPGMMV